MSYMKFSDHIRYKDHLENLSNQRRCATETFIRREDFIGPVFTKVTQLMFKAVLTSNTSLLVNYEEVKIMVTLPLYGYRVLKTPYDVCTLTISWN